MTSACATLSQNVESMHQSLIRINTDYLTEIADQLNLMQNASQEEDQSSKTFSSHLLGKVREGDLLSKKENGPKGLQQDSIVLIKTLMNLDGDEQDA